MDYFCHSSNPQERAKALLIHYFSTLFEEVKLQWNEDNKAEIASIVDNISENHIVNHQQTTSARVITSEKPNPDATAILNYLDHFIEIWIDNPEEGNDIKVVIYYEPNDLSKGYVTNYQFTAQSEDPNHWLSEAIDSAVHGLDYRGTRFAEKPKLHVKEIDDPSFDLF